MTKPQILFAKHDPAMAIADIFRPLKRGERPKLDITTEFNGATFRWRAPDALGVMEQSVLFAMEALAGKRKMDLLATPSGPFGQMLRNALEASGEAALMGALSFETTWRELVLSSGYTEDGGRNYKLVRDAVKRLAELTVWMTKDEQTASMRLISFVHINGHKLKVALNWRLATAITGGQFTSIPLDERAELASDPAKILHAWLAGSIREGKSFRYSLDSLARHIWGDDATGSTRRTRFSRLREALAEIDGLLAWQISIEASMVSVSRIKKPPRTIADAKPDFHRRSTGLSPTAAMGQRLY